MQRSNLKFLLPEMNEMAGIKAFMILLAFKFGTTIASPLHQGDPSDFQCGLDTNEGIKFLYRKYNSSSKRYDDCDIYVKDSLVTTHGCPFNNEALDGKQSEGRLSITSFNEEHAGEWSCAANGSTVYELTLLIDRTLDYGEKLDIPCPEQYDNHVRNVEFDNSNPSCIINLQGAEVTVTQKCPFRTENLTGSAAGLTITCNPPQHSGFWQCAKHSSPVFHLTGYAFTTITHTITEKVIEGKTKLECNLAHYYPSICESESGEECDNRRDSLRWFKVTENGLIELDADSLETGNDTQYEGLYQANSTLTLESKDFEYRCVYKNFLGNESTAIYPGPTVAVEPIAIGVGIVLVIIVIIIVTIYVIKNKKQQNEDAEAHLDKDQSKNVEL